MKRYKVNNANPSVYENHRQVILGPSNCGETLCKLKKLEKIGNKRPIHIITRSPNQYLKWKTDSEIKIIDKYKGSVVFFSMICCELETVLTKMNSSQEGDIHQKLDNYYTSRICFGLPSQSIRNQSDGIILFNQTLPDVESMY